jgi:hypothetical protein
MNPWRNVALALALLASCLFEASCNAGDSKLNTRKGERVIGEWLQKQGMPADEIECPREVEQAKGANFDCKATIANSAGTVIIVKVTQTSDDGEVHIEHGSKIQPAEHVERGLAGQIKDETGRTVRVDCGSRVRMAVPGTKFSCKVQGEDGVAFEEEITITDESGAWTARRI